MVKDSIEVDEATYPVLIEERRVAEDTMGFGEFNGAPATQGSYRSLTGDLTVYYCGDGGTFAPQGVLGGKPGAGCGTWKRHRNGKLERLPDFHTDTVTEKEAIHYRSCGGGGYGDPRRRDPGRVLADVNRRWLSVEAARKIFGVAVTPGANGVDFVIDEAETRRLRKSGARTASKRSTRTGRKKK